MLLKSLLLSDEFEKGIIIEYITRDFPLMYDRMIKYIAEGKLPYSMLEGAFRSFGAQFAASVLEKIDYSQNEEPFVINNLIKAQKKARMNVFSFEYVRTYYLYKSVGALDKKTSRTLIDAIKKLDEGKARAILAEKFNRFKAKMIARATDNEVGAAYIAEQIERQLNDFGKQLTLFEGLE